MATYLVVTATATSIKVEFNDLSTDPNINSLDATFKRSELIEIWHNYEPIEHLKLIMKSGREWSLNLVGGNGVFPLTSIDSGSGVVFPATVTELHTELTKLFI